jgi:Rho termination factor-like protein
VKKPALIALLVVGWIAAAVVLVRQLRGQATEGIVSERPLDSMTRAELYELAQELDIPGRSKMKKTELRAAVSRAGRSG